MCAKLLAVLKGYNSYRIRKKKLVLILKVKKCWEDITMQVKKKERTARHNEINRLKITGNGKLPDDQVFTV